MNINVFSIISSENFIVLTKFRIFRRSNLSEYWPWASQIYKDFIAYFQIPYIIFVLVNTVQLSVS